MEALTKIIEKDYLYKAKDLSVGFTDRLEAFKNYFSLKYIGYELSNSELENELKDNPYLLELYNKEQDEILGFNEYESIIENDS